MKKNMKGFTLIELLAVIVILAIIALISTPIILNVIEESREKSVRNSAYGLVDAAKLEYTQSMFEDASKASKSGDASELKVSGDKPTSGSWAINEEGQISLSGVVFGDYTCAKDATAAEVSCGKTAKA